MDANLLCWILLHGQYHNNDHLKMVSQWLIVDYLKMISHTPHPTLCMFCSKGPSDHPSNSNSTTTGVKPNSSPDLSPSSGPVPLVTKETSRERNQPADGSFAMKTETVQRAEGEEDMKRSYCWLWSAHFYMKFLFVFYNRKWTQTIKRDEQKLLCKFLNSQLKKGLPYLYGDH